MGLLYHSLACYREAPIRVPAPLFVTIYRVAHGRLTDRKLNFNGIRTHIREPINMGPKYGPEFMQTTDP